jgi:hypothetical protein
MVFSCILLSTLGDIMGESSNFLGDFVIKTKYIVLISYN